MLPISPLIPSMSQMGSPPTTPLSLHPTCPHNPSSSAALQLMMQDSGELLSQLSSPRYKHGQNCSQFLCHNKLHTIPS